MFVGNVIKLPVKLSVPAFACNADIALIGEASLLIHRNVAPIAFIVDVICQRTEIFFRVDTGFVGVIVAEIGFVVDTGHDVVAVQIERQVDEIVDVADLIAASLHNGNELFLIAQGKLVNQSGKVVELIKALVLAKHLLDAVDRAFVVGDKPLFVGLTELVLLADPDALKDLLHLFFGGGQLHPLTDQHTLVVLAEVRDEGFKITV